MEYYLSITLLTLTTTALFFYLFRSHRSPSAADAGKSPPGKLGLPLVGESLSFLLAGYKGHPETFIFDRIKKYSSSIFKTHLFGAETVVLCGPSCNKFLFSNENILVRGWWPDSVKKIFPSTATSTAEESIKMRKILPNFFKPEALKNYVGVMDLVAQKHFASEWDNKEKVLVFPLAKAFTFLVACKLFISVEDPHEVEKFEELFHTLTSGLISIPVDFPGTPFNKAIKASNVIRRELFSIIRRRKAELAEGRASPTQDILSLMLLTRDEEDGSFMQEAEIADKIIGLLVGGHDTASSSCASIVKYLAESPEFYVQVYKEQMEIANSKGEGELLNWDDVQRMKYSWNVACEALRLAPPVQGGFREALTDFTLNGFSIPKGWKIFFSPNSTHRSPEHFKDPNRFDPSRFSDGSGPAPYTFVPFGGGPRMCPGKEYARLEILVFMHHLVKRFKWDKIIPDEEMIVFGISPVPAKDLPIRLYPRGDYKMI